MNGEIVNYATQRSEAMMALAFLATLYFGVRAITAERSASWYAASIVACAFGMACKESMVVAPVLVSRNTRAQGVGQGRDGRGSPMRCSRWDAGLKPSLATPTTFGLRLGIRQRCSVWGWRSPSWVGSGGRLCVGGESAAHRCGGAREPGLRASEHRQGPGVGEGVPVSGGTRAGP